ncbi:MAG: hypothetical protein EBY39_13640, partial [Flavobacteriia bacterium]|nr:hypothetical protein [Flavobacteriia bacterium]
ANPSANSVNELYSFMSYKSLANTPEGKVLGYKGVQSDYWSSTGNADTIVLQGETNERHQILNKVGATIEVARRCVDDNKDNHCSFGLHVGSFDYADSWAGENGRLLLVEFDPADAVSVPTDCDFQKLRVSKYKVISDITDTRKELNKPVYEPNKPIYGSNDDDVCDDENCDCDDDCDFVDQGDWSEDDDYDMDLTDKDEGSVDDGSGIEYNVMSSLDRAITDYVQGKLDNNVNPTLNQITGLRIAKKHHVTCHQLKDKLDALGFVVEENADKPCYLLQVVA